jgi:hypothetical protein
MKVRAFLFIVSLIVLFSSLTSASHTGYFIAPDGSDANPGTITKPFASLEKARNSIRQSNTTGPKTLYLRQGTYYLPKTFVLTAQDSGKEDSPVTYRAYQQEEVTISGGMKLALKWKPYRNGIVKAITPADLNIDQLFVNGRRRHMARYPDFDPDATPYNGADAHAFSPERAANWTDPAGGYIHAMHSAHWGGYHYRITGKKDNNEVTYEGGFQNNRQMGMHKNDRFVENIFEELDAPGEWFHNAKDNTLYYMPDSDVNVETAIFEIVRLAHLIEFQGKKNTPISHINIKGFIFRHAARTFMETKEPLLRSDWTIYRGGAILFNGATDCTIADCQFDQLGGNSIFVNNYNRRIAIKRSHIHGSGASGVCFVGNPETVRNPLFEYHQQQSYKDIDKTPGPKSDDYPADCIVDDCLIHNVSVVEKQATGVQVSMSKNITIRHCSIYDVGRAGINISEGTFGGHVIELCDVFDTVRETGDHGSFNSWGRDRFWHLKDAPDDLLPELAKLDAEKTIIRNSRWRCDRGWDIDLDDGSSNYHVYNNLCLNGGIKFREGFNRICENNIMVNNSFHPHVWYKNSRDIFRNNIVFTPYRPIRVPTPWGNQCDMNLLHNPNISETSPATQLQKQSALDKNSITANALFLDPANGDYRVAKKSPAIKLGFKNFPMDKFGVQCPQLKAIARTPVLPHKLKTPVESTAKSLSYWQGATVKELSGEEFSAFGVSKELGGIHLTKVPAESFAAAAGLKKGDLIQSINNTQTKTITNLQKATNHANGKPLTIKFITSQNSSTTTMKRYIYVETESTDNNFNNIDLLQPDKVLKFKSVTSDPATDNKPVSILSDGKLAANYGPVFRNGVVGGTFKIDLGKDIPVTEIRTFSFNQNSNRGTQKFTISGISENNNKPITIASVYSAAKTSDKFVSSRVAAANGKNLGTFRWIHWIVQPVTGQKENTAFHEFQVKGPNTPIISTILCDFNNENFSF